MSDSEEINAVDDNTKTRDELTFIELLAEHVFDPSSITESSEDVNILEVSEEPSLVHNTSLMEVEPATESVNVEDEKVEPVSEPIVEVEEEIEEKKSEPVSEPIVEVEEKKTEPVSEPIVEVEEEKKSESVSEPIVEVEEKKTEPVSEPVKVEEVKVEEKPVVEEPKGIFNKISSSLFSICNWFVKK